MKWKVVVAVCVGVLVLVGGSRLLTDNEDVRDRIIYGPRIQEAAQYRTTIVLDQTTCEVDGKSVDMAWTKTQVAGQAFTINGVFSIYGSENPTGNSGNHSLRDIWLSTGEVHIWLTVQGMTSVGGVMNHWWSGYMTDGVDDYLFSIYVPADNAWHDFAYSISQEAVLVRRTGDNPIGAPEKAGQTHAKECWAEDQWQQAESTQIDITFGGESHSWNVEGGDPASQTFGIQAVFEFSDFYPTPGLDLAKITVAYNQAQPDFSALGDVPLSTTPATSNPPRVVGQGNMLHWYVDDWPGGGRQSTSREWMTAPRIYSFSGLAAVDMDEASITDLLVTCPAVQVYDSSTSTWVPVTQTMSAWNSYTAKPTWGCYSWDADPPPNGAVRTLAGVSFYITEASGKDKLLDGFADGTVSTPSFEHDATMIIDGWWIDSADCTSTPYKVLATITHNDYAELYGPREAVSHDDWVSTGDIGAVDVDGNFTVPASGEGTIYLDLPSNFETRLAAVTAQNFPDGMSIVPGIYWYHRADLYAVFDGEPCAQSGTWSEPPEACYCGWGWPCLRLEFPTCPADALLTVTLTGKTFTHTDNHYTGSVRQKEYDYTPSPFTHTYSCQLVSGVGYVYLSVSDTSTDPDLEVVERITVSGFGDGSWQMAEPRWCEDPTAGVEHQRVKFFENWRYNDGGFSATSGSCVRTALQDGTETNSGKDNPVETRTVRIFDVVESENYMIDLTAAKSLAIMCGDVQNVCDAWTCTYNTAAAEAATTDADGNVLKTVSATDLKPVVGHTATGLDAAVRVYQWTTAPGIEYDFTARKITEGSMQGLLVDETLRTLVRSDTGASVWVRPAGGIWALFDQPTSNAAAVWRADSGEVYSSFDPDVLNEYGVSIDGGDITNTGRWAAREYDFCTIVVLPDVGGRFSLIACLPSNRLVHFYSHGEGIYHIYSSEPRQYWLDSSATQAGYANPHQDTDNPVDDHPSAFYNAKGRLGLFFVREGSVYYQYSDDMGGTWSEEAAVLAGYDVGFVWRDPFDVSPRLHFVGITSAGVVKYSSSFDEAATWETAVQITTGATVVQPSGFTNVNNRICVVFHKDGEEVMWYSDDGQTFTEAT